MRDRLRKKAEKRKREQIHRLLEQALGPPVRRDKSRNPRSCNSQGIKVTTNILTPSL